MPDGSQKTYGFARCELTCIANAGKGAVRLPISPLLDYLTDPTGVGAEAFGKRDYWMIAVGNGLNALDLEQQRKLKGDELNKEIEVFLDTETNCDMNGSGDDVVSASRTMSPLKWVPGHAELRYNVETIDVEEGNP